MDFARRRIDASQHGGYAECELVEIEPLAFAEELALEETAVRPVLLRDELAPYAREEVTVGERPAVRFIETGETGSLVGIHAFIVPRPMPKSRASVSDSNYRAMSARGSFEAQMPVDHMELLAWIADREDAFPGSWLDGTSLMQQASGLARRDGLPWDAVARAAARLRRLGLLDWDYSLWPNESQEPRPEFIDQQLLQRTRNIIVSGRGHEALAARGRKAVPTQVNIVNSTVAQLALGDIRNIDVFVILDAAERALEQIDAPEEAKSEARGVIRRMRDVGVSAISATTREVLAAAVRQALGLP